MGNVISRNGVGASCFSGNFLLKVALISYCYLVKLCQNNPANDLNNFLVSGCVGVIHLAARVHIMQDSSPNSLALYRQVNVDGTLNLARQAAQAEVRRFIFVSSIKVNGEQTKSSFSAHLQPNCFHSETHQNHKIFMASASGKLNKG